VNRYQKIFGVSARWTVATVLAMGLTACDLSVSNPGPVEDSYLDQEAAHDAVVYGAMRQFSNALGSNGGNFAICGGVVTREWHPSGQTGAYSCSVAEFRNQLGPENSGVFDRGQLARWLAEQGVARIKKVRGDRFKDYEMAAPALLFVGYANRLLGENVCKTVIDGGPEAPFITHFERAEAAFTEALEIARYKKNTTYEHAALAGRASVRIWRNNWAGAVQDAALVPNTFIYGVPYNEKEPDQWLGVYQATTDQQKNFTLWNTFYGQNFDQFRDPRTPYRFTAGNLGTGSVPDLGDGRGVVGRVPYWQQRKYTSNNGTIIELSTGREAQLIVAESRLRANDVQGAMTIINQIRTAVGVTPRAATTDAATAWTWLKLEKLIDLWLEGRAVGERRRWVGDGPDAAAPGPLPALLRMDDRTGKDRCYSISLSEYNTNTNLTRPAGT
jgi:hypothetical protein